MAGTRLTNMVISSVHVVDRGDNPEARITMFKRRPDAGEGLPESEVEKIIEKVKEESNMYSEATPMKKSEVLAEVDRLTQERLTRRPELTATSARVEIWLERRDLMQAYENAEPEAPTPEPAATEKAASMSKGQTAISKHAGKVAELRKVHPGKSDAELRRMAWSDPALRDEYNRDWQ